MNFKFPPALRSTQFTLIVSGLFLSAIGSRMQFFALLWHISVLAPGQPIFLGLVGLTRIIPIILFSLVSGVVADSFPRKRIMYITQSVQTVLALTLGYLTLSGNVQLWHLYALTGLEAAAFSFDLPARQSLVPNLLPREHLPNAFSLQSMAFTLASVAGPMLAGIVIAAPGLGQGWAYILNAISFAAILVALLLMGAVPQRVRKDFKLDFSAVREGIDYIWNARLIHSSMILDFIATFFSSATALLPVFAQDILHVDAYGYGLLGAAQSVGAGLTGLALSLMPDLRRQGPILLWSVVAYGLATVIFGLSDVFLLSFLALAGVGASDTVSMVIRNTIRQLQTPDEMRGRMTSINQMFFVGGPQLGELEAGVAAQLFGPVFAVVSGGIGCILGVAWIARRWPELHSYNGDEEILAGASAAD
jgi:MFS family permease